MENKKIKWTTADGEEYLKTAENWPQLAGMYKGLLKMALDRRIKSFEVEE